MADDTIKDAIKENAAAGIQSTEVDGVKVTAHKLQDQIEADKYVTGKDAIKKPHRGLRFTRISPPGAV